jgi:hypothetical protein
MLTFFGKIFGGMTRKARQPARTHQHSQTRLGVEELNPRVLPSAGPFGLAAARLSGHAFFAAASMAAADAMHSSTPFQGGHECGAEATLTASLTDASGATGQASFNATTGTLKIKVQGATASTSLSVAVDGTTVGSVTTDASGNGQVKLSNVSVQAGSTITVGDLQGTFAQIRFTASLSGATGVTGNANYNSLENQLRVFIRGAAADTTYNVTIDNVVVGQVTTNSSGAGKLHVSPSNVTIKAGSTIAISDTAGDPAILQGALA